MRPRQWLKNVLVGAAPAAAGVASTIEWIHVLLAFVSMTWAASAIYLFNDVADIAEDRLHPKKVTRPIASGELSNRAAIVSGVILVCASIAIGFIFINAATALLVIGYLALMGFYSLSLRKVAGVDIIIVAGGFVLRALIGATAASIGVSAVFVVFIGCAALFIVTGKRLSEIGILEPGPSTPLRPTLRKYSSASLWVIIAAASAGMLLSYLVWLFTTPLARPTVQATTVLFVVVALARLILVLRAGGGDEPEELLFNDRIFQCCAIGWTLIFLLAEYSS